MPPSIPRGRRTPARTVLLVLTLLAACEGAPAPPSAETAAEIVRARTQGLALLQQDRLDEAREQFERLDDLAPRQAAGPANLALVALREGRLDDALAYADEAVDRAPDDAVLRVERAAILAALGRDADARSARETALQLDSTSTEALWALAGGASDRPDYAPPPDRVERLRRILDLVPGSLPARFELVDLSLTRGSADSAAALLEEIRTLVDRFPGNGAELYNTALVAARAGDAGAARGPAARLHELMRLDPRYREGLERLSGPLGEATGLALLAFSNELRVDIPDEARVLDALRFRDASDFAGLERVRGQRGASVDLEGDGDTDLVLWGGSEAEDGARLLRNDLGRFVDVTPGTLGEVGGIRDVLVADADGDGLQDLYLVREGPNRLLRNAGPEGWVDVSAVSGIDDPAAGLSGVFVDLDHDADLDLALGNPDDFRVYRNDGAGRFVRVTDGMGVGGVGGIQAVEFADVDDDSDIDLIAARGDAGLTLLLNDRQDRLRMVEAPTGSGAVRVDHVTVGDLDNDGFIDVVGFAAGTAPVVWRGGPAGLLDPETLPIGDASEGALLDIDNDGALDLVATTASGLRLLHNAGPEGFRDLTADLVAGSSAVSGTPSSVFDYNRDGDLDLLVATPEGVRLLRNDGGNLNHYVTLDLRALGQGNGKVNRFAVGSLVEIRAGDLYQVRTVRGPSVHFGLGRRLKADVIRIVWTNGVPQYLYFPGSEAELIESQELKGSCPFVYAWNGEAFEFVTDAFWKSALGMPLGIMSTSAGGTDRIYGPAAASREYVRLPGDRLVPRDGRYVLQITEELWEVAYMDEVKLMAIDHPSDTQVLVDEKFVPPATPSLTLYPVRRPYPPTVAVDHRGTDVRETLSAVDHVYVADFAVGEYQGLAEPHALELGVPPEVVDAEDPHLFLRGWIFPSDASINVAVAQRTDVSVEPNRLQVPDGRGDWRTVVPDIGFPSGKNKTVVVDLAGRLNRDDPRIRITGNTQVYWDHAFFAADGARGPTVDADAEGAAAFLSSAEFAGLETRLLRPLDADLHYRGYSREFRRGGRNGPHWFDYDEQEPRSWIPIPGRYTRYGDVGELLQAPDDRYVVMGPGDEITVEFDADIPAPREGWTRTFLLYTDGWLKDADMNTAAGHTVDPLPFHGQTSYPYGPDEVVPMGPERQAWLEEYQTRVVRGTVRALADPLSDPPGADRR